MSFLRFVRLSRPRFWLYELGTFVLGVVAALPALAHTGIFPWTSILVWSVYFLVPANLLIYGVNDIYDYETDRHNPKKQGYEQLLHPREHRAVWWAIAVTTLPFVAYAIATLSSYALVPLGIFFVCALQYSAPPLRAKARPVLDSLTSAAHYVATGWFGYVLVAPAGVGLSHIYVALLAGMLWGVAMHAYSAVPDIRADRAAGLATIATHLGQRATLVLCTAAYLLSGVLALALLPTWFVLPFTAVYVALMGSTLYAPHRIDALYRFFPFVNALTGALIFFILLSRVI